MISARKNRFDLLGISRLGTAAIALLAICPLAMADHILPAIEHGDIAIRLRPVATGMAAPLYGIAPPGDTSRLFVLEQNGLLRVLVNDVLQPGAALDLQSRVQQPPVGTGPMNAGNANDERGLLGLAFHPDFFDDTSPGYRTLYTYTSEGVANNPLTFPVPVDPTEGGMNNYVNVVSEYKMTTPTSNVIDPASRRVVFTIGKHQGNHNGGTIAFGPDGYLHLATGDGGGANDNGPSHVEPLGNAQVITGGNVLGKVLRIDPLHPSLTTGSGDAPSANGEYRIPATNPFQTGDEVKEIFAYGLRNPYRFSFDVGPGGTGDLILADVGQNNIEEINRIELGENYGWAIKEGTFLFNRTAGPGNVPPAGSIGADSPGVPAELTDPISGTMGTLQYDHGDGISVTGGFVYRGTAIPELIGKYVFGDLAIRNEPPRVDGRLFYADLTTGEIKEFLMPDFANHQLPDQLTVHGFGQDGNGELYAMVTNTPPNGTGGIVYKLTPVPEPSCAIILLAGLMVVRVAKRQRRGGEIRD
jgi:glucose/arabinose dehydrogenase